MSSQEPYQYAATRRLQAELATGEFTVTTRRLLIDADDQGSRPVAVTSGLVSAQGTVLLTDPYGLHAESEKNQAACAVQQGKGQQQASSVGPEADTFYPVEDYDTRNTNLWHVNTQLV